MEAFFAKLSSVQKGLFLAIIGLLVYGLTTAVTYTAMAKQPLVGNNGSNSGVPTPVAMDQEDPNEPRTEACPMDGVMHTKKAKDAWVTRRPLAVMIENSVDARPQSGLTSADIVYEAVAEGGITRFMAIFYCNYGDVQVGPVRSARTYFIDWVSPYEALYAHVGGANQDGPADALQQIIDYDIKSLNQFGIGFPTYWRDYQRLGHPVATEHTMYSSTQKLWDVAAKKGWGPTDAKGGAWNANFAPWKFKDDAAAAPQASKITVPFWDGYQDFTVTWEYDAQCNCYKRSHTGGPHNDLNTNQQITVKNLIVQTQRESRANDGYPGNLHLIYGNKGQGSALIFQDGKVIQGQWVKPTRIARDKYLDDKGQEIQFNRGPIWIQTIPEGSKATY